MELMGLTWSISGITSRRHLFVPRPLLLLVLAATVLITACE